MNTIYQNNFSRDRYTTGVMTELRREMKAKIKCLRSEQAAIVDDLNTAFSDNSYRKLNVINHKIEVAETRLKGCWLNGSYPQYAELTKAVGSKATN